MMTRTVVLGCRQ